MRQAAEVPLEVGQRHLHPDHDVGGDGRGSLAGTEDAPRVEVDRAQLGVGAAEIDQQRGGGHPVTPGALQALFARGEIAVQPVDHRLDPRARGRGAVEAHVEEPLLDLGPRHLAHDEVAPDVEQDPVQPRLDAQHRSRKTRQSSSPWP